MQRSHLLFPLAGTLLTISLAVSGWPAMAATPGFTITATNVTMSSSGANGTGTTTFTLTSVNGYSGELAVGCNPPSPPAGGKIPYCGTGPVSRAYTLTAGQSATGTFSFNNSPVPEVVAGRAAGQKSGKGQLLALAGLLLFGVTVRRRASRWFMVLLLASGLLGGMGAISACGGSSSVVTPGTYSYALKALDVNTSASTTTSISVTVP